MSKGDAALLENELRPRLIPPFNSPFAIAIG